MELRIDETKFGNLIAKTLDGLVWSRVDIRDKDGEWHMNVRILPSTGNGQINVESDDGRSYKIACNQIIAIDAPSDETS